MCREIFCLNKTNESLRYNQIAKNIQRDHSRLKYLQVKYSFLKYN